MSIVFNDFVAELNQHRGEYQVAIDRVLQSGWFILGKEVTAFEKQFATYLGVTHCIGVANGLEAMQISFMALGIGAGDEVITTPLSAVATTLAILAVGAEPVFVDVDECGLMDVAIVEAAISSRTKAILPVHLYGQSVDLGALQVICQKHQLHLVEDAAQAHGSAYQGKKLGSIGLINSFSFYPTKNLGAFGDGGAIVTNDDMLAQSCRQIRDYGQSEKYVHHQFGLNSRLDELQAAILQVRLKYLDQDNAKRRQLAQVYQKQLCHLPTAELITPRQTDSPNYHLLVMKTKHRSELQAYLKQQGILSMVHYPIIIPDQPMFKEKYAQLSLPIARRLVTEILSLPCHPAMSESDVVTVGQTIKQFFQTKVSN